MKTVTRPGEVRYMATKNASLRYPVTVGKKKTVLQFKDFYYTLNIRENEKLIEALDALIDSQWAREENGDYELDGNGKKIIAYNKREVPIVKFDEWADSIQKTPVRLQLDPNDPDSAIEVTPEEIKQGLELLKNKETTKNEEVN